jgi:hypothetical protein
MSGQVPYVDTYGVMPITVIRYTFYIHVESVKSWAKFSAEVRRRACFVDARTLIFR